MINRKVTGIGCFAKPSMLSRIFKKMVRNYTLGQIESIQLVNDHGKTSEADGSLMLKALLTGKAGYYPPRNSDSCQIASNRKITGFFLTCRGQQLNLSIFAQGDCNSRERYTTSLDGLTELRQKRLN
jgi:hypothetical protein